MYDSVADDRVPSWLVIVEGSIEEWISVSELIKVCVNEQNDYSGVQELGEENSVGDRGDELRVRVVSNPSYQADSHRPNDDVEHGDNASDRAVSN